MALQIIFVNLMLLATVIKTEAQVLEVPVQVLSNVVPEIPTTSELESQVQAILDITTEMKNMLDDIKGCTCPRYHDRVFHVSNGRYTYNFEDAKQACVDNDATIASLSQLRAAWEVGYDFCAAGWLADGSVRYPITMPRAGCGGVNARPGIRSWGFKPKNQKVANAFCFKNRISN